MARKVGQIARRGARTWLVRVYNGRDPATKKRKYLNQTVYGAALVQKRPIREDGQVPRFVPVEKLFKGRHFDQEIVVLCVRWYLSYKVELPRIWWA